MAIVLYLVSFAVVLRSTFPYQVVSEKNDIVVSSADGDADNDAVHSANGHTSKDCSTEKVPITIAESSEAAEDNNDLEVDIEETIVLDERDPAITKTLILGLPSPTSTFWSFVTVATNIILAIFVADMVFRAPVLHPSNDLSFTRIGYVSDSSANILLREPDISKLPIYISYREVPDAPSGTDTLSKARWKKAGQIYWLSNTTDYTQSLTMLGLQPSTSYEYAISENVNGTFRTAAPVGHTSLPGSTFTFLTSSCIKPRFPYNPLDHPLTIPGLKHVAKWSSLLKASFMMFLGDFIYVDVPHRFGVDAETYRREYRQVYASPDWPAASFGLPWLHVLDDHEIANDWDQNTTAPYPSAIDPWTHYQASINPPPVHHDVTYFSFTQELASFFMLDTRRYRTPEYDANPRSPRKSMLGRAQLSDLLSFLERPEPAGVHWKVVVSSIPFTRNWRFNDADTWAGYLYERQIILEAMWEVSATSDIGIIVLSGDRHEFAATSFPPPKGGPWPISATVHEFSTSPLSMFYLPTRTYSERQGEDEICIKYVPSGNSKFGAVEIKNLVGGEQSVLTFRLFVDGEEVWQHALSSPPGGFGRGRAKDAVWG